MVLFEIPNVRISSNRKKQVQQIYRLRGLHALLVKTYRLEKKLSRHLQTEYAPLEATQKRLLELHRMYRQMRKYAPLYYRTPNLLKPETWVNYRPKAESLIRPDAVMKLSQGLGPANAIYLARSGRLVPETLLELHTSDLRLNDEKITQRETAFLERVGKFERQVDELYRQWPEGETHFALDHPFTQKIFEMNSEQVQVFLEGTKLLKARRNLQERRLREAQKNGSTKVHRPQQEYDKTNARVVEVVEVLREQAAKLLELIWHPGVVEQTVFEFRRKQIQRVRQLLKQAQRA